MYLVPNFDCSNITHDNCLPYHSPRSASIGDEKYTRDHMQLFASFKVNLIQSLLCYKTIWTLYVQPTVSRTFGRPYSNHIYIYITYIWEYCSVDHYRTHNHVITSTPHIPPASRQPLRMNATIITDR